MRKGMRLHTPFFSVVFLPKYSTLPRFAVVISNKQVPKAPLRARIKRRLRAMIQKSFTTSDSPSQYDCVFLAKATVLKASWVELVAAGEKVFANMHRMAANTNHSSLPTHPIPRP